MRESWDGVAVDYGSAEVERGVRVHYGVAGAGDRTVMRVHGYPQTAYAWRRVVPFFVQVGLRLGTYTAATTSASTPKADPAPLEGETLHVPQSCPTRRLSRMSGCEGFPDISFPDTIP
ncbi:hypothetical protein OPKNFCMD_0512 [Methylobacterium crusticola]|uniref:Alpha/beta hydrolase n=1 Tax=Methylobacterium crusticola TaxID=1697972 RepID=A0ABQ4QRW4_9HYPH|nr:alpha/beta hydrolase [Methylobacterium crusticola]GJD47801.1 hypothetical protein OPKNFCMD_0512 [Methylobacterium crusticola]